MSADRLPIAINTATMIIGTRQYTSTNKPNIKLPRTEAIRPTPIVTPLAVDLKTTRKESDYYATFLGKFLYTLLTLT